MKSNYKETYVPEAEQLDLWDKIITFLKKKTGAEIVLITSPYSYLPYQKALVLPLKKQNMHHSLFGLPEFHDRFNARVRQIADKHGLDVIDFASAVQKHSDPQQLYVPDDGVHLSLKGHQMLAGLILDYLGSGEKLSSKADRSWSLDKKIDFDGNTGIRLQNSSQINIGTNGVTVIADVFPAEKGVDVKTPAADALDMYIFKDRSFFLGRYGNRIYANFHDGNRWCGHTMSKVGIFPSSGKWSQVAAVFEKNDSGTAVTIYLNGTAAGKKVFSGKIPHSSRNFIELGSGWGGAWHYRGSIGKIRFFPKALDAGKIEEIYKQK